MAAQPAAPQRPLKGILRHPCSTETAGAATAVQVDGERAGGGGAATPASQTEELRYDFTETSNQAALASFALCALCGLAVLVSAASFYTSRASSGVEEVTPAAALATSSTAINVSGEGTKAMHDTRVVQFSMTKADVTASAENPGDEEWAGENETPIDDPENQRAPMLVKWVNFSMTLVKKVL
ncbi:hypothetical protein MRX96_032101 [Rhipicephalus microplus]